MKKQTLIVLSLFSTLNGMDQQIVPKREPREWDAQAYASGNRVQEEAALQFLKDFNIKLVGKKVLDIGCGTGNISAKMASQAESVHGIDASENMIKYAYNRFKEIENIKNLSFEHCFAEDFKSPNRYKLAASFFCLHWLEDKQQVLKQVYDCLEDNGELFATIPTKSNPQPINLAVALELIPGIQQAYSFLCNKDLIQGIGSSYPTDDELKSILAETGFDIISYTEKSKSFIVKSREELELFERPLVMSRPAIQWIPTILQEYLFSQYIDLYLTKLAMNEDGHYIFPAVTTTVVHARKVKK